MIGDINLNLNATAILYYDYVLTFGWEVSRFWGRRLTWATFFFYLNRYFTLFAHIPVVMEYFWTTNAPNKPQVSVSFA